jgi:predicted RecB family nuclease
MTITTAEFDAFLKCPTKCFLRSRGETGSGNLYADWLRTQNEYYRGEGIKRLVETKPDENATNPPLSEGLKAAQWRVALDFHAQAHDLEASIHAVERVPSKARGTPAQFIPIRFVFTNKLTRDDKLLLAFDALVLSGVAGTEVAVGRIIHGEGQVASKVMTSALVADVRTSTDRITALLSAASPPDLRLNRHCGECEFQARCRQKAVEKDDLSLLSGLSEKERKKLHSKGIFTVTQLSYTFRPRRRPKRLRKKREQYHHSLKALAIREKKIHIVGSPQPKIEGVPVYLDVEGLPDHSFYYLIGVRVGSGGSAVQHNLWADCAEEEERIWRTFLAILLRVNNPVIVHYGSFETAFLKTLSKRYGAPQPESVMAKAFLSAVNLLSIIYDQIYFPTFSNGLKDIATFLGFHRSSAITSGAHAIVWRHQWETSRDPKTKENLIAYNTDDCKALELTTDAIMQTGSSVPGVLRAVVRTDAMKPQKAPHWGPLRSPIQEFETISRAAHWDYQKDRIRIRQGKLPTKTGRPKLRSRICQRIRKVVVHEASRICPRCGNAEAGDGERSTRSLEDIVFGRDSMKRRCVRHEFRVFRCSKCRHRFGIPERFQISRRYGWEFISFVFHQIIELNIPQRVVVKNLNRLLGFALNPSTLTTLKTSVARYYAAAFRLLVKRIVNGGILHADETGANVQGQSAYVWVFCNAEDVAYIYADTREADLLDQHLAAFRGVLISDFYAAYDAVACPQQKCLIHLLREMNNELMGNPYDEELKQLAQEFARLLRSIVDTVDRYGLKCYHLKKHRKPVECFYKQLAAQKLKSEPAMKWKGRFEKRRDVLFTFLEHDGVSWNNNNAEHAIKAFARLRDVLAGSVTATALEDYLILLSIYQTCEYRCLDFFDFLRSGQQDIDAFQAQRCCSQKAQKALSPEKGPVLEQ